MRPIQVDERVRLTENVPHLELRRGEVGVVCSTWFNPTTAYEVEFLPKPEIRARRHFRRFVQDGAYLES